MRITILILIFCVADLSAQPIKLRPLADTVGFAHTKAQMDSVVRRIMRTQEKKLRNARIKAKVGHETEFKTVISPHDDYTYAGYMYPLALQNVKAKTVILFGVAHKAKQLGLEDHVIFDTYTHWQGPYGKVKVSEMRDEIVNSLTNRVNQDTGKPVMMINDSMAKIEHSLEAEIPFLQYYNKNVEIVPILVPYMNEDRIVQVASGLASAIEDAMKKRNLKWGSDVAIVISADAVHYGDEDWGGRNFAFYGADPAGYKKAVQHEYKIMGDCFGSLRTGHIRKFISYTVKSEDYKEYKWTWCGRYSVPLGLCVSFFMSNFYLQRPLQGTILGYETSLSNKHIKVDDLGGMGITAPSNIHHWVGYPAVGFK